MAAPMGGAFALALACLALAGSAQAVNILDAGMAAAQVDCASPSPTINPPVGLEAIPGDGSVQLTWTAPANAVCLRYTYNITWAPVGPTGEVGEKTTFQVWSPSTTVTGLGNGVQHRFLVRAWSTQAAGTADGVASAIPGPRYCDPSAVPGAPQDLTATSGVDSVRLCWTAPKSGGCVSEYRLAGRIVPLTDEEVRNSKWRSQTFKSAGCMTLGGMADKRSYQYAIQAVGEGGRSGALARAEATVVREWRCMPVQRWYPMCSAASQGECNPQGCAEQAKAGLCTAPWMRQVNAATKAVIQYCAEFCPCQNAGVGGGEMGVEKLEERVSYDTSRGCCRA